MGYLIQGQLGDLGNPGGILKAVRAGITPRQFFASQGYRMTDKPGGGFSARKSNLGIKNLGRAIVGVVPAVAVSAAAAVAAPALIKAVAPIVRGLVKPGTTTIMPAPGMPIVAPITLPTPSPIAKAVGAVLQSGVRQMVAPPPPETITIDPGPGLPIGAPITLPTMAQPIDTPRESVPAAASSGAPSSTPGWILPAVGFGVVALMVLMHPRKRARR